MRNHHVVLVSIDFKHIKITYSAVARIGTIFRKKDVSIVGNASHESK